MTNFGGKTVKIRDFRLFSKKWIENAQKHFLTNYQPSGNYKYSLLLYNLY